MMTSARTPWLRQVRKFLQESLPEDSSARLVGRRRFLQLAGASAGLAVFQWPESSVQAAEGEPIAIVGGGAAGLTAAYRLMTAGREVHLFEAADRVGGRMFTKRNFNQEGMFVELGGELVDTNHAAILALAKELGLETQNLLEGEKGGDKFFFGGKHYSHHDIIEGFKPLGMIIAADVEKMYDSEDNFTAHAAELDQISMADYLKKASETVAPWVIDFIIAAYEPEYGLEAAQMSCLNLVDFIEPDTSAGLKIFGDSDEALRIKGGNGSVPEALEKLLETQITIHRGARLVAITQSEKGISITTETKKEPKTSTWSKVILSLPFTQLRKVAGIYDLPLSDGKKKAIKEMAYGMNVKVMYGFTEKVWRTPAREGAEIFNGSVFGDAPTFQNVWETSRGQEGKSGIITNLLGATRRVKYSADAMKTYLDELDQVFPGIKASHDNNKAVMNWPNMPFNEGSYSCPLVGQYLWIAKAAAATECDGSLLFAGEHTSVVSSGFMNGAVDSGNRAAREILSSSR